MRKIILEERGYFWWHSDPVPSGRFAPDSAITGTLRIAEDGWIELELDAILSAVAHPFEALLESGRILPPEICIQAKLKGSNDTALLKGLRKGAHVSSNGPSFERFRATDCLVGSGGAFPDATSFSDLEVKLTGFEDWLRLGLILPTNRGQSV